MYQHKAAPKAEGSPEERGGIDAFLGIECSQAELPRLMPSRDTSLFFVLWEHSPTRVPLAEARLRFFLEDHRAAPEALFLVENCVPLEQKRAMERTIERYFQGTAEIEVEQGTGEGSEVLLATVTMLKRLSQETGVPVRLRFIDIEDAGDCERSHRQREKRDAHKHELHALKGLSGSELRARFPEQSGILDHLIGSVDRLIDLNREVYSALRNGVMAEQIAAHVANRSPQAPIVVMIGSAHAEVARRFVDLPGFAYENVCLPEEFLLRSPASYRLAFPGPSTDSEAIKPHAERGLTSQQILFEWLTAESLYELGRCAAEHFDDSERFLMDRRVCQVLARTACGALDPEGQSQGLRRLVDNLYLADDGEEFRMKMWAVCCEWLERGLGQPVSDLEEIPNLHRAIFRSLIQA